MNGKKQKTRSRKRDSLFSGLSQRQIEILKRLLVSFVHQKWLIWAMTNGCKVCKGEAKLLKCSGCLAVFYCSKDCQISDWRNGHKNDCKPFEVNKMWRNFSESLTRKIFFRWKGMINWEDTWWRRGIWEQEKFYFVSARLFMDRKCYQCRYVWDAIKISLWTHQMQTFIDAHNVLGLYVRKLVNHLIRMSKNASWWKQKITSVQSRTTALQCRLMLHIASYFLCGFFYWKETNQKCKELSGECYESFFFDAQKHLRDFSFSISAHVFFQIWKDSCGTGKSCGRENCFGKLWTFKKAPCSVCAKTNGRQRIPGTVDFDC